MRMEMSMIWELVSIELHKEIKSINDLKTHQERLYARYLFNAIQKYRKGEKPFTVKNQTKELFFSLTEQIEFLKSLYPLLKNNEYALTVISDILILKSNKRKELFE